MTVFYRSNSLPFETPNYTQLFCCHDAERTALWCYFNPDPRPSFNPTLLTEIRDLQERLAAYMSSDTVSEPIHYFIFASAYPGVFNLGGDVNLFIKLINEGDRQALFDYGRSCIDSIYGDATGFGNPEITTIALVQGSALGGGFECALSCNTIIAEESAEMGFPEILFNLFPGMGALSFLARRLNITQAERLVQSGKLYSGREMYDMGVIDEIAADGEGMHAVNKYIRRHQRAANGYQAIRQASQRIAPVSYQELMDVVEMWVDAALRLTPRDLRLMSKIVAAQDRLDVNDTEEKQETPRAQVSNGSNVLALVPA
jgi:DSF synthase